MDQIKLHIGIHKTGTTSIQRYLALVYDDLLKDGVLYPLAGRSRPLSGHHLLAWAIHGINGVKDDRCWYDVMGEIQAQNPRQTIISAEGFESCNPSQIQKIQHYFQGKSVKVLVYLRNPLDFMLSDYKETIKTAGYNQPFRIYLEGNYQRCNYDELIKRWGEVFGLENIIIRLFDKVKHNPGLLKDFLLAADVDANVNQDIQTMRANISPPDEVIVLFFFMNKLSRILGRRLSGILNRSILNPQPLTRGLRYFSRRFLDQKIYADRDVDWLRRKVKDSNQNFLSTFVESSDHKYFEF